MASGGVGIVRDKLEKLGVEALRDEEILAILLRTEEAKVEPIFQKLSLQSLIGMSLADLMEVKGIGRVGAVGLVAAFELSRRALNQGLGIEPSITKSADAVGMLTEYKDRRREHFVAIFLNARNHQVINREEVAVGSLNASLVHPREVFYTAIGSCAASVILAPNHPSGDVTPSREDIELTRRMVQAGEIIGIEVLDHIVLAKDRFLSMKEAELF